MNSLVCLLSSYLLNGLYQVAFIVGAGWLVSRLLRRLGTRVTHQTWVATLGFAVGVPLYPTCRSLFTLAHSASRFHDRLSAPLAAVQIGFSNGNSSIALPPTLIEFLSIFCLCFLLYFAMRFCWLLYRTYALVLGSRPLVLSQESSELWARATRAFSVKNAVILTSDRISGPATVGLLRPIVLLPEGFDEQCTSSEFLATVGHECAHMKRHDFQKNLFYEFAAIFIDFHPLTWMIKAQISQTREMICDRMATEELIGAPTYTQSLIRLLSMIPFGGRISSANKAIGIFESDNLEERIMTVRTKEKRSSAIFKYGLMTGGSLILLCVAGGSEVMTRPVEAQAAAAHVGSASAKSQQGRTKSCTYYDAQTRSYPGTCGIKQGDKDKYYCFRNDDRTMSELHAHSDDVDQSNRFDADQIGAQRRKAFSV